MTDVERHHRDSLRRLGALHLALGAGMFLLVCYALHGAMNFNPLHLPLEQHVRTQQWLPQGWAFFTRDPQEDRLLVYQRHASGAWTPALLTPHGRPENVLGMDRVSRAQGVEVGQLYERLRRKDFEPCVGRLPACLDAHATDSRLPNLMPHKTLCGRIAIVKQKLLPWAWSAWEERSQMPASAAIVEVQC
jgi:antimicrobial peptide system SdpA family protein